MSELERHAVGDPVYGSDEGSPALRDRLQRGDVPITVYGLDRDAVPLAASLAATSGNVVVTDTDARLVEALARGESPYDETGGLGALVADATADGDLTATSSAVEAAETARVHVVRMATPMDDGPDLSALRSVLTAVAEGLTAGDLVVVESTVPLGTCREALVPLLVEESGLTVGEFGFAFTPERPPNSGLRGLEGEHGRIVGGADRDSAGLAATLFEALTGADVTTVDDLESAEMAGLVAAAYRTVTSALSNELARHASSLGVDVAAVVDAVNRRADCHLPAPDLGAAMCHDPRYITLLREELGTDTRLLDAARVSNELMATHAAIVLFDAFELVGLDPANARVLVVGLDDGASVGSDPATPALSIGRWLTDEGVTVDVTGRLPVERGPYESIGATVLDVETALEHDYDAVVLASPSVEPPDGETMASLGTDDHALILLDGYQLMTELRNDDSVIYRGIGINA